MSRSTELTEKILGGESLGKLESCELALISLQRGVTGFQEVPVRWRPRLGGPVFVVGKSGDIRISIEIDVRGKSLQEVLRAGKDALKAANEMYRGVTSASQVAGDDFVATEHVGKEYVRTRRENVEDWKEGMEEILEGFMGGVV